MWKGKFSIDDGNGKQHKLRIWLVESEKNITVVHVRHALQNEEKENSFVWKRNNGGITAIKVMTRTLAGDGKS